MSEELFLKAVGLFLVAMVRFSGFFLNVPAFGESIVPMRIKAGLSSLCSLIILPHLLKTQSLPELQVFEYAVVLFKELLLGFCLGYVVLLAIDCLKFAGELIGMQIGFSYVQVIDPDSNRGQAVVAEFFQVISVLIFLILQGHLIILQAFVESFDLVPLGMVNLNIGIGAEFVRLSSIIFSLGLQISMPIVAIILLGDAALGIISRTVPRMNIFQVGFPIKILLGLWVILIILPYLVDILHRLFSQSHGQINTLLNLMQ